MAVGSGVTVGVGTGVAVGSGVTVGVGTGVAVNSGVMVGVGSGVKVSAGTVETVGSGDVVIVEMGAVFGCEQPAATLLTTQISVSRIRPDKKSLYFFIMGISVSVVLVIALYIILTFGLPLFLNSLTIFVTPSFNPVKLL